MNVFEYEKLSASQLQALLRRPATDFSDISEDVRTILRTVETDGDTGLRKLGLKFDKADLATFKVTPQELHNAESKTGFEVKAALRQAGESLRAFHKVQIPLKEEIDTVRGIRCRLEWRPIERVGLYVPGGSAPLVSTVLMLGIPALIAGCPEIILCTPPRADGTVSHDVLYAAYSLGINNVFKVGGAQAIAAMAVGTSQVPKVSKIFGPGNRYVTAMKSIVSGPPYNTAIDMLAGPSELLVVADDSADPRWVAADLLSQAEHGADSPVLLVTPSPTLAGKTRAEVLRQLSTLPRRQIAERAMDQSCALLVSNIDQALEFSNAYAPEHLILAVKHPESVAGRITNAGSVFVGPMTSVVFGDYASGTNHTLPTGGLAVSCGGLTVFDFMKPLFFQTVNSTGLTTLSATIKTLARAEGLEAHARAVEVREQSND